MHLVATFQSISESVQIRVYLSDSLRYLFRSSRHCMSSQDRVDEIVSFVDDDDTSSEIDVERISRVLVKQEIVGQSYELEQ